jgi:predicted PurR-regulated permease PerM
MTRQQLFAAFFFAVLLFLLYQFYLILELFLTPLAWAAVLALIFAPVQRWLSGRLRGRTALAAFLLTTLVIGTVIVPTIIVGALLVSESVDAFESLQRVVRDGSADAWLEQARSSAAGVLLGLIPEDLRQRVDLPEMALRASNAASGFFVEQATGVVKNTLLFVVNFFLTTIALFFFLRDGERMTAYVRSVIPMEPRDREHILERFADTLTAVIQGTLLTASAQGLLAGIGFWIAGVDFAVLLGVGTALLAVLPGGAPVVWVPVTIYVAIFDSWAWALFLLIWGAAAVGGIDNVIRPLVIGGRTRIPTVILFFGILGGLRVYGILGLFLAPVVIAILVAFVRIYREQYATE